MSCCGSPVRRFYDHYLEASTDGKNWTQVVKPVKANTAGSRHSLSGEYRYIRLTCTGSNTGGWASLWEVKLFGNETRLVQRSTSRSGVDQSLLKDFKVPEGYEATIFASPPAVNYPVYVAAAPDGTVYVSVDKNGSLDRAPKRGSVYRLRDLDGDGQADEVKPVYP